MATDRSHLPPSIDPVAARRWAGRPHAASPWLHEEVARRFARVEEAKRLSLWEWGAMVHEFNRRQPKPPTTTSPDGLMADDGAPPPTIEEQAASRRRLRSIALPDERF